MKGFRIFQAAVQEKLLKTEEEIIKNSRQQGILKQYIKTRYIKKRYIYLQYTKKQNYVVRNQNVSKGCSNQLIISNFNMFHHNKIQQKKIVALKGKVINSTSLKPIKFLNT